MTFNQLFEFLLRNDAKYKFASGADTFIGCDREILVHNWLKTECIFNKMFLFKPNSFAITTNYSYDFQVYDNGTGVMVINEHYIPKMFYPEMELVIIVYEIGYNELLIERRYPMKIKNGCLDLDFFYGDSDARRFYIVPKNKRWRIK